MIRSFTKTDLIIFNETSLIAITAIVLSYLFFSSFRVKG